MTELPINLDTAQANLDRLLEEARKNAKPTLQDIPLSKIVKDPDLQMREKLSDRRVEEYKAWLQLDPKRLPPIKAYYEEGTDTYWVPNGWHRLAATEALEWPTIPAWVQPGTQQEAFLEAVGANSDNGEPRTNADKRKSITTLLIKVPAWQDASDRQIAKVCNLPDHKLVGVVAAQLEAEGRIKPRGLRKGLDGRVINTSQIGKPAEKLTGEIPQSEEPAKQDGFEGLLLEAKTCEWYEGCTAQAIRPFRYCKPHYDKARENPGDTFARQQAKEAKDLEASGEMPSPSPRQESPKTPAGWCHCGKRAFSGDFCTEHATSTTEQKPPSQSALQDGPTPEESVDRSLAASAPLHPKTLLPLPREDRAASDEAAPKNGYQHYGTPRWIVTPLHKLGHGVITLDPCWNRWAITEPLIKFTAEEDGLTKDWNALAGKGLIYVNPPYANILPWSDKAFHTYQQGGNVALLLPGKCARAWYQNLAKVGALLCELSERVEFLKEGVPDTNPKDDSVLFYLGHDPDRFERIFKRLGYIGSRYVNQGKEMPAPDPRQGVLPVLVKPQEEPPKEEPNDWLERMIKAFAGLRTSEEVQALHKQLREKATTDEERARLQEAFEVWRMRYPHAENARSPRAEAKRKERGKKVAKEESCYCCETKDLLSELRLFKDRLVCWACLNERFPGDHAIVDVLTKKDVEIRRFGMTFKDTNNVFTVTEDEESALKKDARLKVYRREKCGAIELWEEPTYWIEEVKAAGGLATLALIERTYPLYIPKWGERAEQENEARLAEYPEGHRLRPMYEHFAQRAQERKEGLAKLQRDIKDKRDFFSPPAKSTTTKTAKQTELHAVEVFLKGEEGSVRKGGQTIDGTPREFQLNSKALAEWQKDPRLTIRTLDWLEKGVAEMKACVGYHEGLFLHDRLIDLSNGRDELGQIREAWAECREGLLKDTKKPKAPKPKRVKGKNEEPLKPAKKARRK